LKGALYSKDVCFHITPGARRNPVSRRRKRRPEVGR
jgi:hypothetical protein